jgi:arylsulfatase A-like enzyme
MKAIMVMFDSLNRHMLPPYGCDWVHAPNFERLAKKTAVFESSYVCSMPCMPARRDLHTGRPNFLHRSWGPMEPFDDSMPKMLREAGIHSHLVTDHYHYWEEGAGNYGTKYSTWEGIRGQEGDLWRGEVAQPEVPESVWPRNDRMWYQDWINRKAVSKQEDFPQFRTFESGMDFIDRNKEEDNWFLQIETFDPHEPFFSSPESKAIYKEHYEQYRGKHFDWPPYRKVEEEPEEIEHARFEYASLLSMCDSRLGKILDMMDENSMWDDTMLIVWTDHGFMLGEHECWAKCWMPFYEEIARTPFFVWDPRSKVQGERRQSLVQPSIDLAPTLLDFFGLEPTKDMLGKSLTETIANDEAVREYGIFGMHGNHVNVTDGKHVYMRGPVTEDNRPLFDYTLMPTHMQKSFSPEELKKTVGLAEPFRFTKECPTLKIPAPGGLPGHEPITPDLPTMLFDVGKDPGQATPISDSAVEAKMVDALRGLMEECDAPAEQYERLGL